MIQALMATIVEMVALIFALAAGAFLQESKEKENYKALTCMVLAIALAACALGMAAR